MNILSAKQVKNLLGLLKKTQDRELNCDECLQHVAEYAETTLSGNKITEALALVEQHLSVCPECEEEYQALITILKTESNESDST